MTHRRRLRDCPTTGARRQRERRRGRRPRATRGAPSGAPRPPRSQVGQHLRLRDERQVRGRGGAAERGERRGGDCASTARRLSTGSRSTGSERARTGLVAAKHARERLRDLLDREARPRPAVDDLGRADVRQRRGGIARLHGDERDERAPPCAARARPPASPRLRRRRRPPRPQRGRPPCGRATGRRPRGARRRAARRAPPTRIGGRGGVRPACRVRGRGRGAVSAEASSAQGVGRGRGHGCPAGARSRRGWPPSTSRRR